VSENHGEPADEPYHRDHQQRRAILDQRIERGFDRPSLDEHGK
jgi:hypothetical protein